jgi:predicted Zn-dependent peptidase
VSAPPITHHTLQNGLRVLHAKNVNSGAFTLSMHIQAGSRDESFEDSGISHFLEHMLFRGTKRFPTSVGLATALEHLGGDNNGYTDHETTAYWLRGRASRFTDGLDVFSEFFFNPNFADIEIERQILLQELAGDYNESGHCVDTFTLATQALYGKHPLGKPIIGFRENLLNISVERLQRWRSLYYRPENCIFVVSSPADFEHDLKHLEHFFAHPWSGLSETHPQRQPAPTISSLERAKTRIENHTDAQLSLRILFPAYGGSSPKVVAQTFLQRLLDDGIASRLPSSVREQAGLAYDITCDMSILTDTGNCAIDATISEESLAPLLAILKVEFDRLLQDKPSPVEMERVRNRYAFSLETLHEDLSSYLDYLVWNDFLPRSLSPREELEVVRELTAVDIQDVAREILGSSANAGALVGPGARRHTSALHRFLETLPQPIAPNKGF